MTFSSSELSGKGIKKKKEQKVALGPYRNSADFSAKEGRNITIRGNVGGRQIALDCMQMIELVQSFD